MTKLLYHTFEPDAVQREGLPVSPAVWEDGQRSEPHPNFFERWQFDASFSDGSLALITFFTKPLLDRSAALQPGVSITVIPPDGQPLVQAISLPEEDYSASKERCYVRAGESWVRGDAEWGYELHVKIGSLAAHLNFTSFVPAWRPGAGKIYAGKTDQNPDGYLAWLVGMPRGTVEGLLTYNGKIHTVQGTGYHDHRWGNLSLSKECKQWYIGHALAGETAIVFLELTGSSDYDGQKIAAVLIAKGKSYLNREYTTLTLTEQDFQPDPGGRSYPTGLSGVWTAVDQSLHFKLRDPQLIGAFSLVDFLPTWKRLMGGLLSNPYHFTFSAELEFQSGLGGEQSQGSGQGIYELALLR